MKGIDVSNWQGQVDWPSVARAGYEFAICKAGEGTGFTDPTFVRNWSGIKAAGMVRGAYYFCQPGQSDPEVQADRFVALVKWAGLEPGDILAPDLEAGSGDLAAWAAGMLERVQLRVGFAPLLYSGGWFTTPHKVDQEPRCTRFKLWDAAYTATEPPPPGRWPSITIWQHSSSVQVPGIAGNVDEDIFQGSRDQLRALGMPGAAPKPAPPPTPPQEDDDMIDRCRIPAGKTGVFNYCVNDGAGHYQVNVTVDDKDSAQSGTIGAFYHHLDGTAIDHKEVTPPLDGVTAIDTRDVVTSGAFVLRIYNETQGDITATNIRVNT